MFLLNAAKGTVCNATYLYKIPTEAFYQGVYLSAKLTNFMIRHNNGNKRGQQL